MKCAGFHQILVKYGDFPLNGAFLGEMVLWRAGGANTNETNRFHRCFEVLAGAKVGVFVQFI